MNKQIILDEYFIAARSNVLDLAAFLDRVERAPGEADFRLESLINALRILNQREPGKTRAILELLSDPSTEPVASAPGKGAAGAWPDFSGP
jgi:hypothetical protein